MANPIDLLRAKIALLSLVTDKPENPSNTKLKECTGVGVSQPRRTLSYRHELSITQQLAFICAYSEDALHIMATCVKETIPKGCLIIRVAANTGKHVILLDGLKEISRILQNEAVNG
jgi:hypothetical protein